MLKEERGSSLQEHLVGKELKTFRGAGPGVFKGGKTQTNFSPVRVGARRKLC